MGSASSPLERWWWIVTTYLMNKAFLVALGMTVLALVASAILARSPSRKFLPNYPAELRGNLVVNSMESLEFVRRSGRQAEVDAIDLGSLWFSMERARQKPQTKDPNYRFNPSSPPESFYEILREFPNLTIAYVRFRDAQAGVNQVARLKHLRYLSIYSTEFHNLTPFRSLKWLERLDLQIYKPLTGVDSLANLPILDTVVIQSEYAVTQESLVALARLPHLQSLVLAFSNTPGAKEPISVQTLSVLKESTSLRNLYAGGQLSPPDLDLLRMAKAATPHLNVWPALVARQVPLLSYAFPCMMLGFGVGFVLANQFHCSALRLAPGFVACHVAVAVAWMTAVGLAVTVCLWIAGYHPGAAAILTLAVGFSSLTMSANSFQQQRSTFKPNSVVQGLLTFIFVGMLALVSVPATGASIRDANGWMLLVLAAAALTSLGLCTVILRQIGQLEASTQPPRDKTQAQVSFRRGWMFDTEACERRIESWPRTAEYWNWWNRIQRWRAGNPPLRTFRFAALIFVGAGLVVALGSKLLSQIRLDASREQLVLLPLGMMGFVILRIAQDWSRRLSSLSLESIRPCFLKTLQREWAAALVVDLIPVVVVLGLVEAMALNLTYAPDAGALVGGLAVNWPRVPLDGVLVMLMGLPACVGLAAMLVVIERAWVRFIAAFAACYCTFVAMLALSAWQDGFPGPQNLHPDRFMAQLWLPALIGALTAFWMWRRWLAMELERRA